MKYLLMVSALACVVFAGSARADLSSNASPAKTWSQGFSLTDTGEDGTFDKLEISMTGNKKLGFPGLYDQDAPLVFAANGPSHVDVFGANIGKLNFKLSFLEDLPNPAGSQKTTRFNFTVYDWDGKKYKKSGHGEASYQSGTWTINLDNQSVSLVPCAPAVPLPGAVLLGMLGLSAAGLKLRRLV
jgi:hypothetical protein